MALKTFLGCVGCAEAEAEWKAAESQTKLQAAAEEVKAAAAAARPSKRKLKQKLHAHGMSHQGGRSQQEARLEARGLGGEHSYS